MYVIKLLLPNKDYYYYYYFIIYNANSLGLTSINWIIRSTDEYK